MKETNNILACWPVMWICLYLYGSGSCFFFFSRTDPDLDRTFEFRYGSESIQAKTIPVPFLTGVFKKMFTIMFVEHAKKM